MADAMVDGRSYILWGKHAFHLLPEKSQNLKQLLALLRSGSFP